MIDKFKTWLFGSNEPTHPLDRPKEEHLAERRKMSNELEQLRDQRDSLQDELDEKQQAYEEAKEAGEETRAEDILRDAEDIKDELQTIEGKIDQVSKQRNLASNFANMYEIRETYSNDYWQSLKSMDEKTLSRVFSEQEMEISEMVSTLEQVDTNVSKTRDSFREETKGLHQTSELEEEWNDDASDSVDIDPDVVFDTDLSESEDEEESKEDGEELDLS